MITVVPILIIALFTMHILDRYSTETLLNIEVLWHDNSIVREKLTESKLKEDPLDCEKNRLVRKLIKKYGVHRGLWYASFITVALIGFLSGLLYSKVDAGLCTFAELLVWFALIFFLLGFVSHQFAIALGARKRLKKVMNELGGDKNGKKH